MGLLRGEADYSSQPFRIEAWVGKGLDVLCTHYCSLPKNHLAVHDDTRSRRVVYGHSKADMRSYDPAGDGR
jgi:hypothetical protein